MSKLTVNVGVICTSHTSSSYGAWTALARGGRRHTRDLGYPLRVDGSAADTPGQNNIAKNAQPFNPLMKND